MYSLLPATVDQLSRLGCDFMCIKIRKMRQYNKYFVLFYCSISFIADVVSCAIEYNEMPQQSAGYCSVHLFYFIAHETTSAIK